MQFYIIETPYRKALLTSKQLEPYRRAKRLFRHAQEDGHSTRRAIVFVSDHMGISLQEAGHLTKLGLRKLDSVNLPPDFMKV